MESIIKPLNNASDVIKVPSSISIMVEEADGSFFSSSVSVV